jgi:uracil-DNA glycosylase
MTPKINQSTFDLANGGTRASDSLVTVRKEALACRACHLWEHATQAVFGEGAVPAPAMLIGEQPGDKEDLAGKPFVGPAGAKLNQALEEAGVDRQKLYVTNVVKHFKYVQRGRIRLHQKPVTVEIKACHPWLERELKLVQPKIAVAMGGTAAQSLFRTAMPINKNRGHIINLESFHALITVHPSYLLRIQDRAEAEAEYARFVSDLKLLVPYMI